MTREKQKDALSYTGHLELKNKIIAYKGFDENLCCKGFQYEIGKDYEQDGEIECCYNGFHACKNPLNVLTYYPNNGKNRFCKVEQSGRICTSSTDTKIASSRIKILEEISPAELFNAGILWTKNCIDPKSIIERTKKDHLSKNFSDIRVSDDFAVTAISSDYSEINSSGLSSVIASSGRYTNIYSSGDYDKIGTLGFYTNINSLGTGSTIYTGSYTEINSSGNGSIIYSDGDYVKICSTGANTSICVNGERVRITSSGNNTNIYSNSDSATIISNGKRARIDSVGKNAVICCIGGIAKVKAKIGSWITLYEWQYDEDITPVEPICIKTEYVDGTRIKEDTWYVLIDGGFKELQGNIISLERKTMRYTFQA